MATPPGLILLILQVLRQALTPSWAGSLCCVSVPQSLLLFPLLALTTLPVPASICLQLARALCEVKSCIDIVHCSFLSPST